MKIYAFVEIQYDTNCPFKNYSGDTAIEKIGVNYE